MSGAYTAKPVATTPVIVPDGWNPDWDFPGPLPPGYVPDYSLAITSADTMAVGDTLSVSTALYDHDTFETNKPKSTSVLAWTATIDGDPINVKLSSAEAYAASISSVYASVVGIGGGTFWGAEPSLNFQLSDEHNGKTLVLSVASVVDKQVVTQSKEISIGGGATFSFACNSFPAAFAGVTMYNESMGVVAAWQRTEEGDVITESSGEAEIDVQNDIVTINVLKFKYNTCYFEGGGNWGESAASGSLALTISSSGEVTSQSFSGTGPLYYLFTLNTQTGEVSVQIW